MNNQSPGQKGFAPLFILVMIAVVLVMGVVAYGLLVSSKATQAPEKTAVKTVPLPPVQTSVAVGTPECPELDYTGCDTSGNFMTWKDDESKDSEPSSQNTIILK